MYEFTSIYARLAVHVGEVKAQFINGYYATENKDVAAYLKTQTGYITDITKESTEEVVESVAEEKPKTRSRAKSTKKTASEE